jgi:hypothetical protein
MNHRYNEVLASDVHMDLTAFVEDVEKDIYFGADRIHALEHAMSKVRAPARSHL